MTRSPARYHVGAAAAMLMAACGGGDQATGRAPLASSADSGGVELVTLALSGASPQILAPAGATAMLGGQGAEERDQVTFVQGAVLRGDTLIVALGGERRIRAYRLGGDLLWEAGREGDGPGEMQSVGAIFPYHGDSVVVWDYRRRRFSVLDGSGGVSRVVVPEAAGLVGESLEPKGTTADGSFVFTSERLSFAADGLVRPDLTVLVYDADGRTPRILATVPGTERYILHHSTGVLFLPALLGQQAHVRAHADRIAVGTSDRFVADLYREDRMWRSLRATLPAMPPGPDLVRAAREDFVEQAELPRLDAGQRRAIADGLPAPLSVPALGGIVLAADGAVWLAAYQPIVSRPVTWYRTDDTGAWRAFTLPPRTRLLAADARRLVVVSLDDLGLETILVMPWRAS